MIRLLFSYRESMIRVIDDEQGSFHIEADCDVRNELNNRRRLYDKKEVVYAMTENRYDKFPYMPRTFPLGAYTVNSPIPKDIKDKYLYPFFIPTSASQIVTVWELGYDGGYIQAIRETVRDYGYGLHFSTSKTTLGCIRIIHENDLIQLVRTIQYQHKHDRTVLLEVVE